MTYSFTTSQSLPQPSFMETFTYDSVWKDRLYQYKYWIGTTLNYTQTYSYDNAGNVTYISDSRGSQTTQTFEWEGRNLIEYMTGFSGTMLELDYVYNQSGIRIAKIKNNTEVTKYVVDGSRVLYESDGTNTLYYTYDVDGSLISFNYNGTDYFYVYNALGDIVKLLNVSGQVVVEYRYDAFGNILFQTTGALASVNPYRYRGYRYDEETKLYYLNSRYYNPQTGRFLNADGLLQGSQTTLGFNLFAYVENNPVVNTDPSGYCLADANGDGMNPSHRPKCGNAYDNKYNEWYVDPDNPVTNVNYPYFFTYLGSFNSTQEAAIAFANYFNPISVRESREYGAVIYSTGFGETKKYYLGIPHKGGKYNVLTIVPEMLFRFNVAGTVHTHGGLDYTRDFSNFSPPDKWLLTKGDMYVVTPIGEMIYWDRSTQTQVLVSTSIPT